MDLHTYLPIHRNLFLQFSSAVRNRLFHIVYIYICVDDWIPVTTKHIHFLKSNLSTISNTEKENNENSGKQPYC